MRQNKKNGEFETMRVIAFQEFWNDEIVIDQVFQGNKDALILFMAEELVYKNVRDMDFDKNVDSNWDNFNTMNSKFLCEKFELNTIKEYDLDQDILLNEDDYEKVLKIYKYLIGEIEEIFNTNLDKNYYFSYGKNSFYNDRLEWIFKNTLMVKY